MENIKDDKLEGNELIANFEGYTYVERDVMYDIEEHFEWRTYKPVNIYSTVPIQTTEVDEFGQRWLSELPNPDYGNKNPEKWNNEIKMLGWGSINSGKYLTSLDYDTNWNSLMRVIDIIESINDNYHGHFGVHLCSNGCTIQSTKFRSDKPPYYYFADWYGNDKHHAAWIGVVNFIRWYKSRDNEKQ